MKILMLKIQRKTGFIQSKMTPRVCSKLSLVETVMPLGKLVNAQYSSSFYSPSIYWEKSIHFCLLFFLKYTDCFTEDTGKCDLYSWGFQCMLELYHNSSGNNGGSNGCNPVLKNTCLIFLCSTEEWMQCYTTFNLFMLSCMYCRTWWKKTHIISKSSLAFSLIEYFWCI